MANAAIYARISQDRGGEGLGVERQEQDCRALAERKGWRVVGVFVDNDVSAFSGKRRPEWQRLLAEIDSGTVNAIVAWDTDRLTRQPRELEDVIDLAEKHGLGLATVTGEIDLATPTGKMVARVMGATARHESEHKAARQSRQIEQAAALGRPNGGGTRPYGYACLHSTKCHLPGCPHDGVTVIEPEAIIIRECAQRVLAGESLSSLLRDLNRRGVTTTTGKPWTATQMRRLLASARISGRREHNPVAQWRGQRKTRPLLGEIAADAIWPGIISHPHSDRLRALLSDESRRSREPGTGRTYLLSGILRCACGAGMVGRPRAGVARYCCPNTPGRERGPGPHCATAAAPTDEHVRDLVIAALASPALAAALVQEHEPDTALASAIDADQAKLLDLSEMFDRDQITRSQFLNGTERVRARLDRNRALQATAQRVTPLVGFVGTGADMAARWEELSTGQRRAIVSAVVAAVRVTPANPRKRWDEARFDPVWRA